MSRDAMSERARALEEAFFIKENEGLLAKYRQQVEQQELQKILHLDDLKLVQKLQDMGLQASSLIALSYVPLIAVAWADGYLEENEQREIFQKAIQDKLNERPEAYALLKVLVHERPSEELFQAWRGYLTGLKETVSAEAFEQLKSNIISLSERVAEASGGIFGMGSISHTEQEALRKIRSLIEKI